MREVLLDNFTLQGSCGYLRDRQRTKLRESCLQILVESAVLYDRVHVPKDVLDRNDASRLVADRLPDVIVGDDMHETPDLHHHVIDMQVLQRYRDLLDTRNPFEPFEYAEARDIERTGHPSNFSPPSWMGRTYGQYSFSERHLYYSWFCMTLAGELQLNYVPNPTRVPLFIDERFRSEAQFPDVATDILRRMEQVRTEQTESIRQLFASANVPITMPMLYAFVKGQASDAEGMLRETLRLRDSREAESYRRYSETLERALQKGELAPLTQAKEDIETLAAQWSRVLGKSKSKRTWQISAWFLGTEIETPFPNFGALDRKPHFVFVHRLLSRAEPPATPA